MTDAILYTVLALTIVCLCGTCYYNGKVAGISEAMRIIREVRDAK